VQGRCGSPICAGLIAGRKPEAATEVRAPYNIGEIMK
jgi:hypothetical protein